MRVLPSGPRAVLIELDSIDHVMAAAAAVRSLRLPGVIDVVPAARTVLVRHAGIDLTPVLDVVATDLLGAARGDQRRVASLGGRDRDGQQDAGGALARLRERLGEGELVVERAAG